MSILLNFDISLLKEFPDKGDEDEAKVKEGEIDKAKEEMTEAKEAEEVVAIEEEKELDVARQKGE